MRLKNNFLTILALWKYDFNVSANYIKNNQIFVVHLQNVYGSISIHRNVRRTFIRFYERKKVLNLNLMLGSYDVNEQQQRTYFGCIWELKRISFDFILSHYNI